MVSLRLWVVIIPAVLRNKLGGGHGSVRLDHFAFQEQIIYLSQGYIIPCPGEWGPRTTAEY